MPWIKSSYDRDRLVNLTEVASVTRSVPAAGPDGSILCFVFAIAHAGRYDLFRGSPEECDAYMSRLFAFLGGKVV